MKVIKVKSIDEGYVFTIKQIVDDGEKCYGVFNVSGELEGTAYTLSDAKQIAKQGGERVGY